MTDTLPLTLTGTLPGHPDAATGLVHQGGGRWYDPTLGCPLQPNPAGGPPATPQALNRYAATPAGQPGVYQADVSSGIPAVVQSVLNQAPGYLAGKAATALSSNLASRTIYKIGFTGYGLVQAEGTVRQIAALTGEWRVTSTRLASGMFRKPLSLFFSRFRIQVAQRRMLVGKNLEYFGSFREGLELNSVRVSLLERELENVVDDAATREARQLAVRLGSRSVQVLLGGTASALVQWHHDYDNPYLTTADKGIRAGVSFGFGSGAAYVGFAVGGFIGAGVGVVLGVVFDYAVAPWVFQFIGTVPERNLSALEG